MAAASGGGGGGKERAQQQFINISGRLNDPEPRKVWAARPNARFEYTCQTNAHTNRSALLSQGARACSRCAPSLSSIMDRHRCWIHVWLHSRAQRAKPTAGRHFMVWRPIQDAAHRRWLPVIAVLWVSAAAAAALVAANA